MKHRNTSRSGRKFHRRWIIALLFMTGAAAAIAQTDPSTGVATQMVVTVVNHSHSTPQTPAIQRADVQVKQRGKHAQIVGWKRISDGSTGIQLVILIDDSLQARASSNFVELRNFIQELPPSTQVAVGYMQNGRAVMTTDLTGDHTLVAKSIRLPRGIPGGNASPYFCLSDLVKHWPSKGASAAARTVLMITDGIDRYYQHAMYDPDDPYVDAAIQDAQNHHVMVSSIYFRDTGFADRGMNSSFVGQNYLQQVASATGGTVYFEGTGNPVSFDPFLKNFSKQLANQYLLTFLANGSGQQQVKVSTEVPHISLESQKVVTVGQQIQGAE
ncbi:MAG TPA: hypothetical protein VHX63_07535 [Acidobacteriaceae bacterium]|jgi:hypothetical protein|nr:hypothetical protein [Acidobacteriaceae bacterium]